MITNDKKMRIFNYRPLCLTALSVVFTLLIVKNIFYGNIVLSIIYGCLLLALFIIIGAKRKWICLVVCMLIACSFCSYATLSIRHFPNYDYNEQSVILTGRISRELYLSSASKTTPLDGVKINGDSKNYAVRIQFYDVSGDFTNANIGTLIRVIATLKSTTLLADDGIDYSVYNYNIKYNCRVNIEDVIQTGQKYTLADKTKNIIKESLSSSMSTKNAFFAYSALFGDKLELPTSMRNSFSASGAAHLIAVSGLHVGLIVAIITFILNKLKAKDWVTFLVCFLLIGLYAYICNFSISVCRAWIMTCVLLFAPVVRREYDTLSAISLAGIILLVINPFEIFDISALMSFGCVLGIAFFNKTFIRSFNKLHLPAFLSDGLAVSLSAQLGILGSCLLFFRKIQLISTITNIIIIPLFTLAFSVVFVVSMLSIVIPFVKYLLWLVNPIFSLVTMIINFLGGLSFANISTNAIDYQGFMLYNAGMVIASRFCMLKIKFKLIAISVVASLFILNFTLGVVV